MSIRYFIPLLLPRILMVLSLTLTLPVAELAAFPGEGEATPIEQEDMKNLNQISGDRADENQPTPVEREDMKSLDQIKGDFSSEGTATPAEQDDMKSIDQINNPGAN